MTNRDAIRLVTTREVSERLRSRAFRISTVLLVAGVVAFIGILTYAGDDDSTEQVSVAAYGTIAQSALSGAVETAESVGLAIERDEPESAEDARSAIEAETLDAALVGRTVVVSSKAPEQLAALMERSVADAVRIQALESAGLEPAAAERLARVAGAVSVVEVTPENVDQSAEGVAVIVTILLYIAIFSAGYAVSSGIVEEKSSRVVELLLTAIKSRQLLAGKVLGIGIVSLAQVLAVVIAGLVAALAIGDFDLPETTWSTAVLALAYFILGFAFYGCLFAVAGSIVSRQEDSQSTTAPIMVVLIAAYIVSFNVVEDPGSTLGQVLTFIPPFTPMIAPAREAVGSLTTTDLIGSIVVMVISCIGLIWLAGRIYERAILRTGAPIKLGETLRLVRRRP